MLADPAFERSPVQSRLLAYLSEQTISSDHNISQMAVAVDGLGRPETADQLTESYPRVQISRLRRNLSLYYARCAPGEGLAVYIRRGDYQLRLAPPDRAYAVEHSRSTRPAAANDTAAVSPVALAAAPAASAWPAGSRPGRWSASLLVAALVAGLALASLSYWLSNRLSSDPGASVPSLDVVIERPAGGTALDPLLLLAARQADDVASNSFVVHGVPSRQASGGSGYTVRLSRSQSVSASPVLDVALFGPSNQRLFHDSIPIVDDRSAVLARLNAAILHIVGPVGLIASRELAMIGAEPGSDYECVLRTEAERLQGGSVAAAPLQSCLDRFPQSKYRAYWLSRLAFLGYRGEVLSGGVVDANGPAWQDLQQAFAADSSNPFANYLTAKVSFARGDCDAGQPFIDRALTNGNFHGTLMAAALTDASLCPGSLVQHHNAAARVEALVESLPEPNPLLHVYLIFASAAVDRPDLARRLLATPTSEAPQGSLAEISGALEDSLASPAAFAANHDRLQRVVDGFFWGPGHRERLMDKLEAVAAHSG